MQCAGRPAGCLISIAVKALKIAGAAARREALNRAGLPCWANDATLSPIIQTESVGDGGERLPWLADQRDQRIGGRRQQGVERIGVHRVDQQPSQGLFAIHV
jgi:hypothetical protein